MDAFTDEQLMMVYQTHRDGQGQEALDHLYSRYAGRLLNFFYYSLQKDRDKAEDFLHDLFVKVIENRHRFDSSQSFKTWLFSIASNMCRNEYRRYRVMLKYETHASRYTPAETPDKEAGKMLRICINELDQEKRSLIVLRFKLNLSVKELAGIFQCPEGTVKSRLFNAVREISKLYNKQNHGIRSKNSQGL